MDRDRDRRDDRYSNTYRPRSPAARVDSYRSTRSPPRRGPVLAADTYTPGSRPTRPRSRSPTFRRRSRSPRRDDTWRARPRSPPRRAYSPPRRDDYRDRGRSPRRDTYDSYTRSPAPRVRDRSPPPRERDASPAPSRSMRSPVRGGRYEEPRSRAHSPYRRYSPPREPREPRRRSPSPRRERADPYTADTWRRRSPSPARAPYTSNEASGRESAATSRRSSPPPIHPSRAALVDRSVAEPSPIPRSPRDRESRPRDRDYDRDRDFARDRDYDRERARSPPRHRDAPPSGPRQDRDFAPPSGPSSSYRNGDANFSRAPPTGPSGRSYGSPALSPPAGGSATPQGPSYPRSSNPVLAAPTRPSGRGRGSYGYDAPRDFSGPPYPRRGSAQWGPRGGHHGPPGPHPRTSMSGPSTFNPAFRGSSNSTSTTYPRTQRFRDHLTDLPKEVQGGQRAPEAYDKSKLLKLEEDARRLRELIEQKESAKRQSLKEWDALEREANTAALKVELAEEHLRNQNGEADNGTAF